MRLEEFLQTFWTQDLRKKFKKLQNKYAIKTAQNPQTHVIGSNEKPNFWKFLEKKVGGPRFALKETGQKPYF